MTELRTLIVVLLTPPVQTKTDTLHRLPKSGDRGGCGGDGGNDNDSQRTMHRHLRSSSRFSQKHLPAPRTRERWPLGLAKNTSHEKLGAGQAALALPIAREIP